MLAAVLMALTLAMAGVAAPAYAKNLKASGVKFTAKNKVVATTMWVDGVGKQKYTYKISNVKIKKAAEEGYVTVTFKITMQRKWAPAKAQVTALVKHWKNGRLRDGHWWYLITDYDTGKNLEVPAIAKKYGVSISSTDAKYTGHKMYGNGSQWVNMWKKYVRTVSVTYPESYKGLCIGFGTGQTEYSDKQMAKWEKGKVTYAKSWWNKKNNATTRFIRIK